MELEFLIIMINHFILVNFHLDKNKGLERLKTILIMIIHNIKEYLKMEKNKHLEYRFGYQEINILDNSLIIIEMELDRCNGNQEINI